MTDPRAALAEALGKRRWEWLGWTDKASSIGQRRDTAFRNLSESLTADLAERGVRLVTEPMLAAAMDKVWQQGRVWVSDRAEVAAIFAALSGETTE